MSLSAELVTFLDHLLPKKRNFHLFDCIRVDIVKPECVIFVCVCEHVCTTSMQMSRNLTQSLKMCIVHPLVVPASARSLALPLSHFVISWQGSIDSNLFGEIVLNGAKYTLVNLFNEYEWKSFVECCLNPAIVEQI